MVLNLLLKSLIAIGKTGRNCQRDGAPLRQEGLYRQSGPRYLPGHGSRTSGRIHRRRPRRLKRKTLLRPTQPNLLNLLKEKKRNTRCQRFYTESLEKNFFLRSYRYSVCGLCIKKPTMPRDFREEKYLELYLRNGFCFRLVFCYVYRIEGLSSIAILDQTRSHWQSFMICFIHRVWENGFV